MVKKEVPTTPFLPARQPALPQPLSKCCAHCFTYPAANGGPRLVPARGIAARKSSIVGYRASVKSFQCTGVLGRHWPKTSLSWPAVSALFPRLFTSAH